MKRKFCICMLVLFLVSITTAIAEPVELTTLEYCEIDIVSINGNRTLIFNHSDTGTNEINFLWRIYSQDADVTLYMMESMEIDYDHTFVNDTKSYIFKDDNSVDLFVILVDYSILQIPDSLEDLLNLTIQELEQEITRLENEIANNSIMVNSLNETLNTTHDEIAEWMVIAEQYKQERDIERNANKPLYDELEYLNYLWEEAQNDTNETSARIDQLKDDKGNAIANYNDAKSALEEGTDPMSIGYTFQGKSNLHLNVPSLFFGILITIAVVILAGDRIKEKIKRITGKEVLIDKTPKKSTISKALGGMDARDYDDLQVTDHPKLKNWREGKPAPVGADTIPEFTEIKVDETRKEIDDLLSTKTALNNTKSPEVS